jgi:hypothetical protein
MAQEDVLALTTRARGDTALRDRHPSEPTVSTWLGVTLRPATLPGERTDASRDGTASDRAPSSTRPGGGWRMA